MNWPLAQIVDSLDRANVLFDFNPGKSSEQQMWLGADDFDYGAPEWEQSIIGPIEGSRVLSLAFRARGRYAESAISRLSDILTRTTPGYMMWQTRKDSDPIWFRLRRQSSANPLDFSTVWADDADRSMWRWKVDLAADAFALGARQDLTATTQLAQAGQPIMPPVELTDTILGDAPAPLNLDIDAGDLTGYATQLMSWAMDPAATVSPWAGTPANPDMVLTGTESARMDTLDAVPPPGQFRCLLYVTRPTTYNAGKFRVSLGDGYGNALVSTPEVIMSPGTSLTDGRWLDCGRLSLPAGVDFTDLPEDALGELDFMVSVASTSSSGPWNIGNFTLIPVHTVTSRAATTTLGSAFGRWPGGDDWYWPNGGFMRVDSERSRVGIVDQVTGKWLIAAPPVVDGSFPRVHPGARNFLMFLPRMNDVAAHSYGASGETNMWYHPRYLHIGAR